MLTFILIYDIIELEIIRKGNFMKNNSMGIATVIAVLIAVISSFAILSGVKNAFPKLFPDVPQSTVVDNPSADSNAGDDLLMTIITQ